VASPTRASVFINELSPATDPEWIELYNPDAAAVDLTDWSLVDGNTSPDDLILSGTIPAFGLAVYEHKKGWLNDSGDTLTLSDNASPAAIVDSLQFDKVTAEFTVGRVPDGQSIKYNLIPTKGNLNLLPTETPTPTPTSTPSPTPTPTPTATLTATPNPTASPVIITQTTSTPKPTITAKQTSTTTAKPTLAATKAASPPAELILGVSETQVKPSETPQPTPTPKSEINPNRTLGWLAIAAGLILLGGCITITYLQTRKTAQSPI